MSGYLYFPNNLKDIKYHIQADIKSCKIFFQLMVTVFKEKLNLQLPLISEQIAENRFEALLEISDKFITKFNVFSYMILQFRLKTVWKISKPYCMTLKTVARQFCLKRHSLYHKSQGRSFQKWKKDMKVKHSVSPTPCKVWGDLFRK